MEESNETFIHFSFQAEIRSRNETEALISLDFDTNWGWLGINDYLEEGTWTYSKSGDVIGDGDYTNWNLNMGEPDGGREENFVIAYVPGGWLWMDYREEMMHNALCEKFLY